MKIRSIAAALALLLPLAAAAQMRINIGPDSPLRKLQMAELAIANLYVDSVDEQKLVEDGIRGMIEKLDPHSSYSTAKEVKALTEPLAGNFEGIGVQFNMIADTMLVIQPVAGGPSERVGILAGDRIVAVNDTAIAGVNMPRDEIMRRLRGPKGTKVDLEVVRRGYSGKLAFTVTRDKIPVESVDAAYMISPHLGYIRIGNFGATTHGEFVEALDKLLSDGMQTLILDLQDNGGGYLQAAVEVANEFLSDGDLIVYTPGRRRRSGPPLVRQGPRAAPHRPARRLDDTPHRGPLLHSGGPLHTEAIRKGRRQGLCHGLCQPPAPRRAYQPR